jgi:hypothetical protein
LEAIPNSPFQDHPLENLVQLGTDGDCSKYHSRPFLELRPSFLGIQKQLHLPSPDFAFVSVSHILVMFLGRDRPPSMSGLPPSPGLVQTEDNIFDSRGVVNVVSLCEKT